MASPHAVSCIADDGSATSETMSRYFPHIFLSLTGILLAGWLAMSGTDRAGWIFDFLLIAFVVWFLTVAVRMLGRQVEQAVQRRADDEI